MILPSQLSSPATETAGYFETSAPVFAEWLAGALGLPWRARGWAGGSLAEAVELVRPHVPLRRYLLLPVSGGWTVLLNDGPLGTDVGVLPMHAARELHCRSVRAVAAAHRDKFPATIMEVYDPAAVDDPMLCRRAIYAVDDGGRWEFGESGERFEFEDVDAYRRRRVRDRFTPELLERYLIELGVPVNESPDVGAAVVVEKHE
jgi:hypothetical protein